MADDSQPHNKVILDACCLINLCASGHIKEILLSLGQQAAVAEYVVTFEVLSTYARVEGKLVQQAIDLSPLSDEGLLSIVSIGSELEEQQFVNFAAVLGDDGEAATSAIAVCRAWSVATDDRKAIGFLARNYPNLSVVSTLEIMRRWMETSGRSPEVVSDALRNIRELANYQPGIRHPMYDWWQSFNS